VYPKRCNDKPEEAIKRAEKKCQGIWKKWGEKGKI